MGIHRQRSMSFNHEKWERERPEMLIYLQEPMGFTPCPSIVCPRPPPPIIVSFKAEPEDFGYQPYYIMASNELAPLDVSGVKDGNDNNHFQAPYQGDYQTVMGRMEAHYAMLAMPASSSFQDHYHVSAGDSPEVGFPPDRWAPPTYAQVQDQPYAWPSDYYLSDGTDYQTAVFQPHGLPNFTIQDIENWRYANGTAAMRADTMGYTAQAGLPSFAYATLPSTHTGGNLISSTQSMGGSFSSTFSSSTGDNFIVPEAFPPRAFHNNTPVESYAPGGRVQELPNSPHSATSHSARSCSASSAGSPAAMDSDAAGSSPEQLAPLPARPKKTNSSKGHKKSPNKQQARRWHLRRRSSPQPKPDARPNAPSPRHKRVSRNNTKAGAERSGSESRRQPESRAVRQAQLRPVLPAPPSRLALPAPASPADRRLTEKDELLLQYKEAGMGYKEIKKLGGFSEAVSTLRGRYRTITKPKEARVRKPAWTDRDLRLLEQGVRSFASGSDLRTAKIPWMRVAAYIKEQGGYHFGNSTCRKRWDDLFAGEVAAGKDPSRPFHEQWSPAGAAYGGVV